MIDTIPLPDSEDAMLLARWRAGDDEGALAVLMDRHRPGLAGLCARLLGGTGSPEVDDAVQQVFITLARRSDEIREPAAVGAWLRRTALRTCANIRRERDARRERERGAAAPAVGAPPQADVLAALDGALAAMPGPLRQVVQRHYFDGRPLQAIAGELGEAPAAIRKRLQRALGELRRRLGRREAAVLALLLMMPAAGAEAGDGSEPAATSRAGAGHGWRTAAILTGAAMILAVGLALIVVVTSPATGGDRTPAPSGPAAAPVAAARTPGSAGGVGIGDASVAKVVPAPAAPAPGPVPERMPAPAESGRSAAADRRPPALLRAVRMASRVCPVAWCLVNGDRDGDGVITVEDVGAQAAQPEYRARLRGLGIEAWTPAQVLDFFDHDHDGRVSLEEYLRGPAPR